MQLDTVCYSLDQYFDRFLQMKRCHDCMGPIDIQKVEHSVLGQAFRERAIMPHVETLLARCTQCDWWAVREFRDDVEFHGFLVEDDLVVPRPRRNPDVAHSQDRESAPWEEVLAEGSYWSERTTPTFRIANRIFGSDAVAGKGLGLFGTLGKMVSVLLRRSPRTK